MDDILRRMMAVEAEADQLVKDAEAECETIRSEARRQANVQLAEAQKKLTAEVDEYVKSCLEKALAEEKEALQRGDERMKGEMLEFEKRFSLRLNQVTELLLYPDAD